MESEVPKETPPVVVSQPSPEKKPFHLNKWHVIAAVLVAVVVIQSFLYLSLNSNYSTLNADHESLTSEHQNLANQYNALTSQHSKLQSKYNTLQDNYDSLNTNFDTLQTDYNSLQIDYDSLQTSYDGLHGHYDSYVSSYDDLRNLINKRTLQFGVTDFITPNDIVVKDKVTQITGGWSDTSNWNEFWSDVKTMYDWVVNNVEYRSDGLYPVLPSTPSGDVDFRDEMWQLPSETLDLLQGDCEDMAILLTSMILCYNGGEYWTECIALEGSASGHVGVQMLVAGNKLTILDPAGNYYTQISGSIASKDISAEIGNWLNYWKPQIGSDVYVDRVFSDDLDKSFSSTSEYTSWMYSR